MTQSFNREKRPFVDLFNVLDRTAVSSDGRWFLDVPLAYQPERLLLFDMDEAYPAKHCIELKLPDIGFLAGIGFTPDTKRIVATYRSGLCRVWDISPYTSQPPHSTVQERQVTRKWETLASDDAATANDVMNEMIRSPKLALAVIGAHLPPPPVDAKFVAQRIQELGDRDFQIRDRASKALATIAHQIDAELVAALATKPSPEATDRLKKLLAVARSDEPTLEVVQTLRALEVLEAIGSPEAIALVEKLGSGSPDARLTRLAKESRSRLQKR